MGSKDFTDKQCRMVATWRIRGRAKVFRCVSESESCSFLAEVMIGIPYPSKNDLRVMLKQELGRSPRCSLSCEDFLDLQCQGLGQRWYHREAMRAVNQTLGRVIRHRPWAGFIDMAIDLGDHGDVLIYLYI